MRKTLITAVVAVLSSVMVGGAVIAASGEPSVVPAAIETDAAVPAAFDLQSHRGGRGEWTEGSLTAFEQSLALGVTTLELDTRLSQDERIVVWHDDVMSEGKCADTAPVVANDPDFPYAGDPVHDLTLAQIQTLDCGYRQLNGYPHQENVPGARILELSDVFALVHERNAAEVRFNIETKVVVPGSPAMADLTRAVVAEIKASGLDDRSTLQSFDWASLNLARQLAPDLALAALANGDDWLGVGQPGASRHLGGIDIDDFHGSLARAAHAQGYDAISPAFRSVTPELIVDAHSLGLPVIPWTVSETALMHTLIDMGVDGIITDYPTRLRAVLAERGLALPNRVTVR